MRNDSSYSDYVALGFVFPTNIGAFDVYWQGVNAKGNGWKDSLSGWETGYSYRFELEKFAVTPRIALGQMSNINYDMNSQTSLYSLISTEISKQITNNIGLFVSVSHMNGMNQWAIPASNRLITGLDFTLPNNYYLRVGYSNIRQFKTTQDGIMIVTSKSF